MNEPPGQTCASHLAELLQDLDLTSFSGLEELWRDLQHLDFSVIEQDFHDQYGCRVHVNLDRKNLACPPTIVVEYEGTTEPPGLALAAREKAIRLGIGALDLMLFQRVIIFGTDK